MKRKGVRRGFKFVQPINRNTSGSSSTVSLTRWWYIGAAIILLAVSVSWPPWEDPGLLPMHTGAQSPAQATPEPTPTPTATPLPGAVLGMTAPTVKQGIFIVTGAGFVPGDRVLLYAQPSTIALIRDLDQARAKLPFLAEVIVSADGRLYAPINPRAINIPIDMLPATIIAYTIKGYVPSVIPVDLYANQVQTPMPVVPALPATPIPLQSPWEMGGYRDRQLSGQQRADHTVNFPKCDQLGDDASASARWTSQVDVPLNTHYLFVLKVVGSARLSIDGAVIIDEWRLGDLERTQKVYLHLMHGLHDVQLEYSRPRRGHCKLSLSWNLAYPDWCGLYRNNTDFTGEMLAFRNIDSTSRRDSDRPLKTQKDPSQFLYIDWGVDAAAPEINPDNWSVDITRSIMVTESAYYKFALDVGERDEARAYIDQHPLIDHWVGSLTWSPPITLSANQPHFVQVQFRDLGGAAMLRFVWVKLDWPN